MRLHVFIEDTLYSDAVIHDSLEIRKDISDRMSTARATFKIPSGGDAARYDEAQYGIDVRELYEVRIEDDGGNRHFAGQISRIEKERPSSAVTFYNCDLTDYTWILEQTVVPFATFTGQSDRAILQSLIGSYAPQVSALTANVAQIVSSVGYFEVREKTLRQAIEELCELTGGEWRVDYYKALHYFLPTANPAPFSLSSEPNGTTSFGIDAFTRATRDFIRPVNRCTVIGGLLAGGTQINITYDDPVSQSIYGVRATTIVDREITLAVDATLRAKAIVDQYAYPQESISLTTFKDGLEIGQSLTVFHSDYQISGQYIIRSIQIKQEAKGTLTKYSLSLGAKEPDASRLLRQLEARTRRNTQIPEAVPGPGSVGNASISGSGLSVSHLTGEISATGNVAINANALFGNVTAGQDIEISASVVAGTFTAANGIIVNANTLQGVITGPSIAVDVQTFQGAIISSQVADGLIDRLSLLSEPLRWIPNLASDPTLPDVNYPAGSFYRRTGDNQFRKNVAGSWANATESEAISGKLAFHSIGTIKAGSIIGLIAAGQIDNINAGQIVGGITAGQITSVNMSSLTGTLTVSNAGRINVTALQGTLTVGDAASVNVNALTGTLTTGMGATINVGALNGQINGTQIENLAISGTHIQNLTITGGKIATATIDSAKIISLEANKITAGTIAASVTMTSPTLVISSGTATVNIDASNMVRVADSGFLNRFSRMTSTGFRLESLSSSSQFATIIGWGFNAQFSSGGSQVELSANATGGVLRLFTNAGSNYFSLDAANALATTASSGARILPGNPAGFLSCQIGGSTMKIPYYNF
jgi:hypothetical protein